jgi:Flp pilus assembly protein TadG
MSVQSKRKSEPRRKGAAAVTVTISLPFLIGFAALSIDMGYLYNVQSELQAAADSSALAGASGLAHIDNREAGGTSITASAQAQSYALQFAARNEADGDAVALGAGDIEVGILEDLSDPSGPLNFGNYLDYNAVRVKARRTGDSPGGPVGLFFARILNKDHSDLAAEATAILDDRFTRFTPPSDPNTPGSLLPFTLSIDVWNTMTVSGPDQFAFTDGQVVGMGDGTPEAQLYPWDSVPGNFGLLHVGDPTDFSGVGGANRLAGQITDGIRQDDLVDFNGEPFLDIYNNDGSPADYTMDGDTGLSAGLKDEIEARVGQVVGFFVHDSVSAQGTLGSYHVIGMRFARLMEVDLQGGQKAIWIQPEPFVGDEISDEGPDGGADPTTSMMVASLRLVD